MKQGTNAVSGRISGKAVNKTIHKTSRKEVCKDYLLRLLMLIFMLSATQLSAYEFVGDGTKWPGARTTIYTGIPGVSPSGIPWASAYADAAREWSEKTSFTFDIVPDYRDPCLGQTAGTRPDYANGVDFGGTICGRQFTSGTLALTMFFTQYNMLGSADLVEADIIFNRNVNFDIYDGPQRPGGQFDFRRTALHELGHALGLAHENTAPAIMAPRIGNIDRLQPDDINGVNFLYAGIKNCQSTAVGYGWIGGELTTGDCQVRQLISGGTDTSFVDVYTFHVSQPTTINLNVITDNRLDSVLLLTDPNLRILALDERSAGNCNPRITQPLQPGDYVILVNTYSNPANAGCGRSNTGSYRVSLSYQLPELKRLHGRQSFQGGVSEARFSGGVTTDQGKTFNNRVSASQRFDVSGRIEIDPRHRGQSGFIVVAGVLAATGQILVKTPGGEFVDYQPEQALIPIAERRVLGEVEDIEILRQMVAKDIGIDSIEVNFLIGYGVDSQPDELFFHEQPINLIVE